MSLIRSSCSATQTKAPTSPTRRVPMVRAKPKSATGGESAGPNTDCRANDRCLAESHSDWEAIRYRRPATRRSNMFILSSRHVRALLSSERCVEKAREGRRRRRYAIRSAKVGLGIGEYIGQRVREYSRGMRQRLGVATAVLGNPELLVLDEPM